jgi:hypothetical protein
LVGERFSHADIILYWNMRDFSCWYYFILVHVGERFSHAGIILYW